MRSKPRCDEGTSCGASCISSKKHCTVGLTQQGQRLAKFLHLADHLGENVVSWKIGKVVGQAIAQTAVAAGVPPELANIVSESVVQAGAATAIHTFKKSKEGEVDPIDSAAYFVQQIAAAGLGKISHTGMEGLLEMQAMEGMIETLAPLVAGKGAGVLTATRMAASGLDRRIAEYVAKRSKADLSRLRSLFSAPVNTSEFALEFEEVDKQAIQLLYDLTMATYALIVAATRKP